MKIPTPRQETEQISSKLHEKASQDQVERQDHNIHLHHTIITANMCQQAVIPGSNESVICLDKQTNKPKTISDMMYISSQGQNFASKRMGNICEKYVQWVTEIRDVMWAQKS